MSGTTSPILSLRYGTNHLPYFSPPRPASAVLEANLWFMLTWPSHCPPSHRTSFPGPLFSVPPKWLASLNSRPVLALGTFCLHQLIYSFRTLTVTKDILHEVDKARSTKNGLKCYTAQGETWYDILNIQNNFNKQTKRKSQQCYGSLYNFINTP